MKEVGLHEGIEKIKSGAFDDCPSLRRLAFPTLSTRLDNITRAGQAEVGNKIENIRGIVERRGSELFVHRVWARAVPNWSQLKGRLSQIDRLITYYELKEATVLLELAMWKAKIDEAEVKSPINRDVYRIDIPGPVKKTISQYLISD